MTDPYSLQILNGIVLGMECKTNVMVYFHIPENLLKPGINVKNLIFPVLIITRIVVYSK